MKNLVATAILISIMIYSCDTVEYPVIEPDPTYSDVNPPTYTINFDCTDNNPECTLLDIKGDPPSTWPTRRSSTFSGYADPCVRADISTASDRGILWMTYSWPYVDYVGRNLVTGIATHLAKSKDGGHTWTFQQNLWVPEPMIFDRDPGFMVHEVSNILPVHSSGHDFWLGARLNYFLPNEGGAARRKATTIHIQLFKSSTIEGLSDAEGLELGTYSTDKRFMDINLEQLIGKDLNGFWSEPALYFDGNTAYLALRFAAYSRIPPSKPRMLKDEVYVFSFDPNPKPTNWELQNEGVLADHTEAEELGGETLTQIEITKSKSGQLILLATPMSYDESLPNGIQQYVHHGVKIVEIESLSPPKLKRGQEGKLAVRASIIASDNEPAGPGASGYDPACETGIFLVKRDFSFGMHVEIRKTHVIIE